MAVILPPAFQFIVCTYRPWNVLLVDQRCHGASAKLDGFSPPHTLAAAATDLAEVGQSVSGANGTLHPMVIINMTALAALKSAKEPSVLCS
jgi:pimeloyl-ACP methyl ester carboxylesterase